MTNNTVALESNTLSLADGEYQGLWSGHKVTILNTTLFLYTTDGIRTLSGKPVKVIVSDGIATVTMY